MRGGAQRELGLDGGRDGDGLSMVHPETQLSKRRLSVKLASRQIFGRSPKGKMPKPKK